ncbi:hypothetical protein QOZ80_4AG0320370 [Eleusine coracana subsp. coracana]|nr:hypothetical protein QOZ80_4AG0320370 [Eleusine coracana subsp. coracana]
MDEECASIAMDDGCKVVVPKHPLVKHCVAVLRHRDTQTLAFKHVMAELGRALIYEATKDWLPTVTKVVPTPIDHASVEFIDETQPILNCSHSPSWPCFLRARDISSPINKDISSRDEETLQPSVYLNKLPDRLPDGCRILLMDPMLATGGTMITAIDLIKDRGAKIEQIRVISALTCPSAIEKLKEKFPGICVYVAAVDPFLNDKGFLIPGLGDAGDRINQWELGTGLFRAELN